MMEAMRIQCVVEMGKKNWVKTKEESCAFYRHSDQRFVPNNKFRHRFAIYDISFLRPHVHKLKVPPFPMRGSMKYHGG